MKRRFAWSAVLLFVLAPFAQLAGAHSPMGTPKNYCEPPAEWYLHDWNMDPPPVDMEMAETRPDGPTLPSLGEEPQHWPWWFWWLLWWWFLWHWTHWHYLDGNVGGDCEPGFNLGRPCANVDPNDPLNTLYAGICEFNPPLTDYDGHHEFGYAGWALMSVTSGNGEPSADPSVGAGSLYCHFEQGHHPTFGTFFGEDILLGTGVTFSVGVDIVDLTGTGQGCGDGLMDASTTCFGSCTVTFPPGLDGAYHVQFHSGAEGHAWTW